MTAARMRNYLPVEMPDDSGSLTLRVTPERVVGGLEHIIIIIIFI
jgi:hypothetical protein